MNRREAPQGSEVRAICNPRTNLSRPACRRMSVSKLLSIDIHNAKSTGKEVQRQGWHNRRTGPYPKGLSRPRG